MTAWTFDPIASLSSMVATVGLFVLCIEFLVRAVRAVFSDD